MAKNQQKLNLSYTIKLLLDISKSISGINAQLSVLTKNVNGNLNKSLEKTNQEAEKMKKNFEAIKAPFSSSFFDKINESLRGKSKTYSTIDDTWKNMGDLYKNEDYQNRLKAYTSRKESLQKTLDQSKLNYKVSSMFKGEDDPETQRLKEVYLSTKKSTKSSMKENKKNFQASGATMSQFVKQGLGTLSAQLIQTAIKVGEKVVSEAKKVIESVATYSVSTSYKVNSEARNQMLTYGLSESQNYAFTQTKSLMGISSDEDLFWMNDNQRQMFSTLMSKETEIYNKMMSDGTLEGFQEMQIDLALLKQEFYANVVQFISQHKDLIINAMETGMGALTGIMYIVGGILTAISKLNPANWSTYSGNKTITLNNYVSTTNSNASTIADETTNKTLASLSSYANS